MNELNDLYDIIDAIRKKHRCSSRQLALLAKIPPTTLASMMSRRPATIDKDTLARIATVFSIKWYELLNKPASFANTHDLEMRIPTAMSPEDIQAVREKFIDGLHFAVRFSKPERQGSSKHSSSVPGHSEDNFKRGILFVLDKLNDEGLMEAMRRILDVANEPHFCMHKNENQADAESLIPQNRENL